MLKMISTLMISFLAIKSKYTIPNWVIKNAYLRLTTTCFPSTAPDVYATFISGNCADIGSVSKRTGVGAEAPTYGEADLKLPTCGVFGHPYCKLLRLRSIQRLGSRIDD
jgi:hypothetical protein